MNHIRIASFDTGILLFVILITSLVTTIGLIVYQGDNVKDVLLSQMPGMKIDRNNNGIDDRFEDEAEVESLDDNQKPDDTF